MIAVMDETQTPRVSVHARERCAEMGISTKVAKHIVRHPSIDRPGNTWTGCRVAVSDLHPEYAVVYDPECCVIVTVLFRTTERYARQGQTFVIEEQVKVTRRGDTPK